MARFGGATVAGLHDLGYDLVNVVCVCVHVYATPYLKPLNTKPCHTQFESNAH